MNKSPGAGAGVRVRVGRAYSGRRGLWVAAALLAACTSCTTTRGRSSPPVLEGTDWRLIELNGERVPSSNPARGAWIRFQPDSGRVAGSGGCNRLSGGVQRNGTSLTFGALLTTKMACADSVLNQTESDFLSAVQSTDRYELVSDTLGLLRAGSRVLRFVR